MSSATEYTAFLPNTLLTVVNSKAFIPFQLSLSDSDQVSLAAISASQHQRHAELLTLPANSTFEQALTFFKKYDITAVPIIQQQEQQQQQHQQHHNKNKQHHSNILPPASIVGIFTIQDLFQPFIFHPIWDQAPDTIKALSPRPTTTTTTTTTISSSTSTVSSSTTSASSLPRLSGEEFRSRLSSLPLWHESIVSHMSSNDSNRPSWLLPASSTVKDAAISLSSGLRHILVMEGTDRQSTKETSINILSAGDLLRFCYTSIPTDYTEHSSLPTPLYKLLSSTISTHLTTTSVITVNMHDTAIAAFRRLAGLGAIPVVNNYGMIEDNLSASDFRHLSRSTFALLLEPLSVFIESLRHEASERSSLRPSFAASVPKNATFYMLLQKAVNLGISRIWIVDEEAHPIGVFSLSDVFRLIVNLRLDETLV